MAKIDPTLTNFLDKYAETQLACTPYALSRMGVDRTRTVLKIEDYMILCAPMQLSFNKIILLASLSRDELVFFQRFKGALAALSMEFNLPSRRDPLKLFIRVGIDGFAQMKGRENAGMVVLTLKNTPEDLVLIMGSYLEHMERLTAQYEASQQSIANITPETSKLMGYNQYAVLSDSTGSRRIKVFRLSVKEMEHLEGPAAPVLEAGSSVQYQLFFQRYRMTINGTVREANRLPTGMLRTKADLSFSPELVEILDDYWFQERTRQRKAQLQAQNAALDDPNAAIPGASPVSD